MLKKVILMSLKLNLTVSRGVHHFRPGHQIVETAPILPEDEQRLHDASGYAYKRDNWE